MKEQRVSLAVVLVLFVLGGILVTVRHQWRQKTRIAPDERVWRLDYDLTLESESKDSLLRVALPTDARSNRVVAQELEHSRMRVVIRRTPLADNRLLEATAPLRGRYELTGKFHIHVRPKARWKVPANTAAIPPNKRVRWLKGEPGIHPNNPIVREALAEIRGEGGSTKEVAQRIYEFCRKDIEQNDGRATEDLKAITSRVANPLGKCRVLVALCRAAQIPARLVCGFDLESDPDAKPKVWAEVRLEERWVPFDPVEGFRGELPTTRVVVRRGSWRIVDAPDEVQLDQRFRIQPTDPPEGLTAPDQEDWTEILDITRLPLSMHGVLATLLLLPFGAVIVGVFRNIIGIRTFGTFAPVLLAMAFLFTDWLSGLLVLVVILVGGLSIRHVLNHLKLLMVARLGVVLTMVVTCLVLGISTVEFLSRAPNPQLVILPMVILTGLVEQIYITSEEDTFRYTMKLIIGTTVVGVCCFLVLDWKELGRLVLRYPELHLFTMGALILIGRYAGYRLTELWRFHDLVRGTPPAKEPAPSNQGSSGEGQDSPEASSEELNDQHEPTSEGQDQPEASGEDPTDKGEDQG